MTPLSNPNSTPAHFRFVHFSDLHLCHTPWRTNALYQRNLHRHLDTFDGGSAPDLEWNSLIRPASYVPEVRAGVARFCHWLNHKHDGIIVSGDLATTGRGNDLQVAKIFVAQPPAYGPYVRYNEPTISACARPERIHLVPGNHDRYVDDFGTPGSPHFVLMFQDPYMQEYHQGEAVGFWKRTKLGISIGFVYADFSLRRATDVPDSVRGCYGMGKVHENTFLRLKNKTRELSGEVSAIIWVIHFAPYDYDPTLELVGFKRITDAARELGVLCTLCGHTHDQQHFVIDGHNVFCAGSAGCVDRKDRSSVHLIEVTIDEAEARVKRRNFRWSWRQDSFVEQDPDVALS